MPQNKIEYDKAFEVTSDQLKRLQQHCGQSFAWRLDGVRILVKVWDMSKVKEIEACLN